jgi:hypothetical protein
MGEEAQPLGRNRARSASLVPALGEAALLSLGHLLLFPPGKFVPFRN